jgi:hypothetical protein
LETWVMATRTGDALMMGEGENLLVGVWRCDSFA